MKCPVCNSIMSEVRNSRTDVSIVMCTICGFLANDLDKWEYPYSGQDYYANIVPSEVRSDRPYVLHRVREIMRVGGGGRSVDLGCGLGETVVAMNEGGFAAEGVEESGNAVSYLKQRFPAVTWHEQTIAAFVESSPAESFDVVTLYHVLEHIPYPRDLCVKVARILKPGGLLVVEVPDVSGGQALLRGWKWQHWLPHHVNYFDRNTLGGLLEPLGFELYSATGKYHFGYPQGIWWRDMLHGFLARVGMRDIITTYWRKSA